MSRCNSARFKLYKIRISVSCQGNVWKLLSQTSVTLDDELDLFFKKTYFTIHCFLCDGILTVSVSLHHQHKTVKHWLFSLHSICYEYLGEFKTSCESIYSELISVSFSDKLCTFHHHKSQHHVWGRMTPPPFWRVFIVLSIIIINTILTS